MEKTDYSGIIFLSESDGGFQFDFGAAEAFMKSYGVQLPDDYVTFLKAMNGGRPFWPENHVVIECTLNARKRQFRILQFYPFKLYETFTCQPSIWKMENLIRPPFLFEIAVTNEDKHIYIGLTREVLGYVFLIDLRRAGLNKLSSIDDVLQSRWTVRLADSFDSFMSSLKIVKKTVK